MLMLNLFLQQECLTEAGKRVLSVEVQAIDYPIDGSQINEDFFLPQQIALKYLMQL